MEEKEIVNEEVKKPKIWKKILFFLILILTLFIAYIYFIEPKIFTVNENAIIDTKISDSMNGLKIVQFSDIHYGTTINQKELNRIVKKINELKPDVLIFNGDLFDKSLNLNENAFNEIKETFQNLDYSLKKYAVIGDSDYVNKEAYLSIMDESGFKVLENANDFLYYNSNTPIMFIGTSSILENEINIEAAKNTDIDVTNYFKLWIAHEPIIIDELSNLEVIPDVILSSHTMNGLINIPYIGYLLRQDGVNNYTSNYYHQKKIKMYINNGLGTTKYNIRFNNTPSINLYRLYNY